MAYVITTITDPPPPQDTPKTDEFLNTQIEWKNKERFLALPILKLDQIHVTPVRLPPEGGWIDKPGQSAVRDDSVMGSLRIALEAILIMALQAVCWCVLCYLLFSVALVVVAIGLVL
jgi:hypothetical protein